MLGAIAVIVAFASSLYVTRFIIIMCNINYNRGKGLISSQHTYIKNTKTLIVLGSGGHTSEMLRLVTALSDTYYPRYYVLADTDRMSEDKVHNIENNLQYSILRVPRSREVSQSYISSIFSTLYAIIYSFPLVFYCCPDLVICNGPGTCIPICFAALLLKIIGFKKVTTIYVESICRVETLSMSGRILYYMVDQFLVQWPQLQHKYPRTSYLGRLV